MKQHHIHKSLLAVFTTCLLAGILYLIQDPVGSSTVKKQLPQDRYVHQDGSTRLPIPELEAEVVLSSVSDMYYFYSEYTGEVGNVLTLRSERLDDLSEYCRANTITYYVGTANESVGTAPHNHADPDNHDHPVTFIGYYNENDRYNKGQQTLKINEYYYVPARTTGRPHQPCATYLGDEAIETELSILANIIDDFHSIQPLVE